MLLHPKLPVTDIGPEKLEGFIEPLTLESPGLLKETDVAVGNEEG
jgi:hypothetical protein